VHTWPEQAGVTVDVYVCNFGADHSGKAQRLMEGLMGLFAPEKVLRQSLRRGEVPAPTTQIAT
jgi:S-adenosylmethionine/arginine decarboxylase-like enzyme